MSLTTHEIRSEKDLVAVRRTTRAMAREGVSKQSIQDAYCALLEGYVRVRDEALLAKAADLGRELVALQVPAEEVAAIHGAAARRLAHVLPDNALREAAALMSAPLTKLLMAYSLVLREQNEEEETLAKHREHLEQLVKDQTVELEAAREELVHKEQLAALGQLVATVSHEIRNPLGTIHSSIFSVGERVRGRDKSVDRALARAERNIQRCDHIIEELLSYTRNQPINLTATDIDGWLDELLDEMPIPEGIRRTKKLRCNVRLPIDPERLRRCVINVIDNACQAMSGNKGNRASLLTVETSVADGRVRIQVRDTGPGIPPDRLGKIFEPLHSTKTFGMGLGLSIVKQIMEQHRGGVEMESREGEGALVTLWLPRGEQEVQLEQASHSHCR
jgi:signal transduction histidine kinase